MTRHPDRRTVLAGFGAFAAGLAVQDIRAAAQIEGTADLVLFNGRITTLDRQNPERDRAAAVDGVEYVVFHRNRQKGADQSWSACRHRRSVE